MASPAAPSLASDAKNDSVIDSVLQANKPPSSLEKHDEPFGIKQSTSAFSTTMTGTSRLTEDAADDDDDESDSKWDSDGEGSDPVSNAVDGQAYITGAADAQKEVVKGGAASGAAETEKKATAGVVSRGSMNLESEEEEDEEESTWEREAKLKRVSLSLHLVV